MKHTYIENGSKWFRVMDGIGGRPELHYANEDARPYWKSFGTGAEHLMIEKWGDDLLLRSTNEGEEGKGRKETWIHLDKEMAAKVGAFLLQGRHATEVA